jgi:hypothetical protein
MEEKFCHGEAADKQLNSIDENMLNDDFSLKPKIEKERKIFNEKKELKNSSKRMFEICLSI